MINGKHLSEDHKKKLSDALKGRSLSEITKLKMSKSHMGKLPSEITRNKLSITNKGKHHSTETKRKISEANKGKHSIKGIRLGIQNPFYGKCHIDTTKKTIALKKKVQWQNPEYREKVIKNSLKGLLKRPTSLEKQMLGIIQKHGLPYKYTGDGSFLIGYKNPDFVNTDGQKVCIEVANTFHHNEDYEEKRKEHFAKWGWHCIVFRTDKLDETEVLEKLHNAHTVHLV